MAPKGKTEVLCFVFKQLVFHCNSTITDTWKNHFSESSDNEELQVLYTALV